jgi:NADH:ubiquinone oxidoreductase subunit F (NADH-binding)
MSLPRLLLGVDEQPMTLDAHHSVHGPMPAVGRREGPAVRLVAELKRSRLRGRGGGGFPLARKIEAILDERGTPVVVVNAAEGEPMSVKDRMLLESLPHLVLDGAFAVADAVGTTDVVVVIDETFHEAAESMSHALADRPELPVGRRAGGPRIAMIPSGYVTGQETAVVNFLNNGIALPTFQPPRITQRGVGRRPTIMSNAETLAHTALIARHGGEWFNQIGTDEEPGSALVTMSGAVAHAGVYEIEYGFALSSLVQAAGGVTEPIRAFLLGGYAGSWVDARAAASLALSRDDLSRVSASLGAGILVALPSSACPVAEVANVAEWMAQQSAHQCGPCVHGLDSIASALGALCDGAAPRSAFDDVARWSRLVLGRGACAHPDGVARFVTSALDVFATEFADHARHGPCEACAAPPVLLTPRPRAAAVTR